MEAAVGLVGVVSAALGAAISYLLTKRNERTQATMELFNSYHTTEHHSARARAARYLDDTEAAVTFNLLWKNPDTASTYEDLWQVTYFWFGFLMLSRQNQLNRGLAGELFRYQYEYWQPRLKTLADSTANEAADSSVLMPEWVPPMRTDFLAWLRG